jgi:hypothetical protein
MKKSEARLQCVLHDLQIIETNFYRDTIRSALDAAGVPPLLTGAQYVVPGGPFKCLRKEIVHLLLVRKVSLDECRRRLGFPPKNNSAIAMQLHQFCREKNLKLYRKGEAAHPYHLWSKHALDFFQSHASEFLKGGK